MKTYKEYYEEWVLSTESRDLAFDEWLMLLLDRKEEEMTNEMRKLNEEWEENLAECKRQRDAYYDELTRLRQAKVELIGKACIAFKHFMVVQYGELIDESMEMYWKRNITKALEE